MSMDIFLVSLTSNISNRGKLLPYFPQNVEYEKDEKTHPAEYVKDETHPAGNFHVVSDNCFRVLRLLSASFATSSISVFLSCQPSLLLFVSE